MRIVVISQEDSFTLPGNVEKLLAIEGVEVPLIVTLDTSGTLLNRKAHFVKGFGLTQAGRMATALFFARSADAFDAAFGYRLMARKRSLRAVAGKHGTPYRRVRNLHAAAFLRHLESLAVDLLISYSAPSKFRRRLLAIPKIGCLNLHCSYLPAYAGLLPSFWVLYHQEKEAGATVHFMDEEIDGGEILGQVRVPIEPDSSMFRLIRKTKEAGGDLTVQVVEQLIAGKAETRPNPVCQGSYFSWPTLEEMRRFRQRGGRLI